MKGIPEGMRKIPKDEFVEWALARKEAPEEETSGRENQGAEWPRPEEEGPPKAVRW